MFALRRPRWQSFIIYAVLTLYLAFVLLPILWVIQGSFKTTAQALMLPPAFIFEPTFEAYRKVFLGGGLSKSPFAVTLVHLTINLPLAIWLLRGYFAELPEELEESARLDGASQLQLLWYIVIPMGLPMLMAVSALVFMLSWNEFLFAFILTSSEAVTVPVVITAIAGTMRFDWPLMSALASLSLVPAFILVAYLQRHIVRGLTMGAIK
jgi:multiple sugar transport system permease protein